MENQLRTERMKERTQNCAESQAVPVTDMNRSTTLESRSKQSQLDSISQRNSVQFGIGIRESEFKTKYRQVYGVPKKCGKSN